MHDSLSVTTSTAPPVTTPPLDTVPPGGAGSRPGPMWGRRMRDFLTDGSVAALCDELALLLGVPIWLRDQSGEVITPADPAAGASEGGNRHPWAIVGETEGRARAHRHVGIVDDGGSANVLPIALEISTGILGAIVARLPADAGTPAGGHRVAHIRRSLELLASSVCDVCEAQVALSRRVRDLDALLRLSSLISADTSASPDGLLRIALELAMEVLQADAGSIAVLEDGPGASFAGGDDGREPIIKAHRGLSAQWVNSTTPLSRGGLLRQAALAGEIIAVEDLAADPRMSDRDRIAAEGLRSLLTTGLRDQGRPIGLIRLYTRTPRVFTQDEGELLRAIAEHAAGAVATARLRALRRQDEAMKRQLRLAASVQRRMLPRAMPNQPPFDIAAHYAPSYDLGGDFYDFLELGGHLGILVGDVVGKGVPAALLMSAVRASFRAYAQDVYHIDEVLRRVNRALVRDTLDNEFATVWYGVVDPQSLRLTYCGAGHDWPLLVRVPRDRPVEDRDVQRLTADGMALGIDEDQKYPKGTFQLQPRDVLLIFTDGLHDATNFEGKRFGGTRLRNAVVEVLAAEPEASATRIVDHVLAQVRQHTGLSGRSDDLTVVVMRVGERA